MIKYINFCWNTYIGMNEIIVFIHEEIEIEHFYVILTEKFDIINQNYPTCW